MERGKVSTLRNVQWVPVVEDRQPTPSAGSLDSQTAAKAVMVHRCLLCAVRAAWRSHVTTFQELWQRHRKDVGYDGGKKIKGRKRFTLVDTLGLLMVVKVVA